MRLAERWKLRHNIPLYLLLLPGYLLLAVFTFVPFIWAFTTSLYDYEIGGTRKYVGLTNYSDYFHDFTFLLSFRNMLFLALVAMVTMIIVPLVLAKLIFSLSSERARYAYRVLFLIPIVIPVVAQILIWKGMIYSEGGLVNEVLRLVGMGHLTNSWLADPHTALAAVALVGFPFAHGVNILIFYAGLSSIPGSVHEAAWLDGASGVRKFLLIDIPLVLSQIKLLLILTIIGVVQGFQGIFLLTRGMPGFETTVPGLWMYFNAFNWQRMGYACAIGVILFLLIAALTALNTRYLKSSEQLQGLR